jgi:hypothetical protein
MAAAVPQRDIEQPPLPSFTRPFKEVGEGHLHTVYIVYRLGVA